MSTFAVITTCPRCGKTPITGLNLQFAAAYPSGRCPVCLNIEFDRLADWTHHTNVRLGVQFCPPLTTKP